MRLPWLLLLQLWMPSTVDGADNANTLVANTTADATPASFYFLAVDASTGAIEVTDKNFVEVE